MSTKDDDTETMAAALRAAAAGDGDGATKAIGLAQTVEDPAKDLVLPALERLLGPEPLAPEAQLSLVDALTKITLTLGPLAGPLLEVLGAPIEDPKTPGAYRVRARHAALQAELRLAAGGEPLAAAEVLEAAADDLLSTLELRPEDGGARAHLDATLDTLAEVAHRVASEERAATAARVLELRAEYAHHRCRFDPRATRAHATNLAREYLDRGEPKPAAMFAKVGAQDPEQVAPSLLVLAGVEAYEGHAPAARELRQGVIDVAQPERARDVEAAAAALAATVAAEPASHAEALEKAQSLLQRVARAHPGPDATARLYETFARLFMLSHDPKSERLAAELEALVSDEALDEARAAPLRTWLREQRDATARDDAATGRAQLTDGLAQTASEALSDLEIGTQGGAAALSEGWDHTWAGLDAALPAVWRALLIEVSVLPVEVQAEEMQTRLADVLQEILLHLAAGGVDVSAPAWAPEGLREGWSSLSAKAQLAVAAAAALTRRLPEHADFGVVPVLLAAACERELELRLLGSLGLLGSLSARVRPAVEPKTEAEMLEAAISAFFRGRGRLYFGTFYPLLEQLRRPEPPTAGIVGLLGRRWGAALGEPAPALHLGLGALLEVRHRAVHPSNRQAATRADAQAALTVVAHGDADVPGTPLLANIVGCLRGIPESD